MWGLVLVWLTAVITPAITVEIEDNSHSVKNPNEVSIPQIIDSIMQRETDLHSEDINQYTVGLDTIKDNNKNKKVVVNIKKSSQQTNDGYKPTQFKITIKRKRVKNKSSNADTLNSNVTNLNAAVDKKIEVTTESSNNKHEELSASFLSSPEQTVPYIPGIPEYETHGIHYQVSGGKKTDSNTQSADSILNQFGTELKGNHIREGGVLDNLSSDGVVINNGGIKESMSNGEYIQRYVQANPHEQSDYASNKYMWKNGLFNRSTRKGNEKFDNKLNLGFPVFKNENPASLDKQDKIFDNLDRNRLSKTLFIDSGVKPAPVWEIREPKQWNHKKNSPIDNVYEKHLLPVVLTKTHDISGKSRQYKNKFVANDIEDLVNVFSKLKEAVTDSYLSENENHADVGLEWENGKYEYNDTYGKWTSMRSSKLQDLLKNLCSNLANSRNFWQLIKNNLENIRPSDLDNLKKLNNIFHIFSKYLKVENLSVVSIIEDILENAYRKRLNRNQPTALLRHNFVDDYDSYKNHLLQHQTPLKNTKSKTFNFEDKRENYNAIYQPYKYPDVMSLLIGLPKNYPKPSDKYKYNKKPKRYESNKWISVFDHKNKIADENSQLFKNVLDWSVNEPTHSDGLIYKYYKPTPGEKTWNYVDGTIDSNPEFPFLRTSDVTSTYQLHPAHRPGNEIDLNDIKYSGDKSKDSYENYYETRVRDSFKNSVSHEFIQPVDNCNGNMKLDDVKVPIQPKNNNELDKLSDTVASVTFDQWRIKDSIAAMGQLNDYLNEKSLPKEAANKMLKTILGSYVLHNTQTSSDKCLKHFNQMQFIGNYAKHLLSELRTS